MISVTKNYPGANPEDIATIKKFVQFTLDMFVPIKTQKKSKIHIRVLSPQDMKSTTMLEDFKNFKAWCVYGGYDANKTKKFTVVLNANKIRKGKKTTTRLKGLLLDLAHEMVHVKQYLNNELKIYIDGSYKFLGKRYAANTDDDFDMYYYNSPEEIEAYGRENGLYQIFCNKIREESFKN